MGLDAVEIVMRTEDEFGITLADDEAETVRSVDDLYQLVLSKLDVTNSCLSSKAFYRTRQALVACLQVQRRAIRPTSDLELLLPLSSRRQQWNEIAAHIRLEFPRLHYPARWRQRFLTFGAVISAVVVLTCSALIVRIYPGFITGFALWIPAFAIWMILCAAINSLLMTHGARLQTELPCQTAGDLSRLILTSNYEHFSPTASQNQAVSKEYVWRKLVEIICDQLQVQPEKVVPRATFAEDLGVD